MSSSSELPGYIYEGSPPEHGGLHVLCVGISKYPGFDELNFAAISALRVFAWFVQAARSGRVQLASARLYVTPTEVEEALIMARHPERHAFLTSARGSGEKAELDRVLDAWVSDVRGKSQDSTLFYFAGHGLGLKVSQGDHFNTALLSSDFDFDSARALRAVRLQHVFEALASAGRGDVVPTAQMYLLDCCRQKTWRGQPAEQGALRIRAADAEHADTGVVDTRRLAMQFACQPGSVTMGRDNAADGSTENYTYYSDALIAALDAAPAEISASALLSDASRRLSQAHPQLTTQQVYVQDFPLAQRADGANGANGANAAHAAHAANTSAQRAAEPGGQPQGGQPQGGKTAIAAVALPAQARARRNAVLLGGVLLMAAGAAFAAQRYRSSATQGATPIVSEPQHEARTSPLEPVAATDMQVLPEGHFRRGSSLQEARAAFTQCLAYGARFGNNRLKNLPCDCPFESSSFVRETWIDQEVSVARFSLDRYEVTNADFAAWLNRIGSELRVVEGPKGVPLVKHGSMTLAAVQTDGRGSQPASQILAAAGVYTVAPEASKLPVVSVSWNGATAFCRARGMDLPTETQWEYAARGVERREYPWGSQAQPRCDDVVYGRVADADCATLSAQPSAVGSAPLDRALSGVADLGGNVAEWVRDELVVPASFSDSCQGAAPSDPPAAARTRVIRGGAFADPLPRLRAAARSKLQEDQFSELVGFRCATNDGTP